MWERCCVYSKRERKRKTWYSAVRMPQADIIRPKKNCSELKFMFFLLSYFEIVLNYARTAQLDINQKLNDTAQRQQWNKEVKKIVK